MKYSLLVEEDPLTPSAFSGHLFITKLAGYLHCERYIPYCG